MKAFILGLTATVLITSAVHARPGIVHCESQVSDNYARILTMGPRVINVKLDISGSSEHFGVNEINRDPWVSQVDGERYSLLIDGSLSEAAIYESGSTDAAYPLEQLQCYTSPSLEPKSSVTACSKDLNFWKNPSQCGCVSSAKTYNPQSGTCQQGIFSGYIAKSNKLHPLSFEITSYNGFIKKEVFVPLNLIETVRDFADRRLPGSFEGEYRVYKNADGARSDFTLTYIGIEE
ncbi:MAG: hypothetical protein ACOH5I_25065 [Oligoflexus sp.]